jgi:glycosyltransferase involved in cell wall biosynthesis
MPTVSVIIPCFNLGQYIDEAVDSVLSQTFQDFEIIIVNDGSTDEFTNDLLIKYNKLKTKVYITTNQGVTKARNYAIERASGDYICCLDADDIYHVEFLEQTVRVFEEDIKLEYGIVTTNFEIFENSLTKIDVIDYNQYALATENAPHGASLFRKKCWKEVGGYVTNMTGYQDWNFWLAIITKGYKWFTVKEYLFYYRDRDNSMVKTSDKKRIALTYQIIENNKEYYLKNSIDIIKEYINKKDSLIRYIAEMEAAKICLNDQLIQTKYQLSQISTSRRWLMISKIVDIFNRFFPCKSKRRKFVVFNYRILKFLYSKLKVIRSKGLSILCVFKKIIKSLKQKIYTVDLENEHWHEDLPLVSVVIPCYNYGKYIEEAIDSVLNQTFQNFEIIVVEGGSTDETTLGILKKMNKPKTNIYYREGRHLVGDNRNFGINIAKGKYICCLDADDIILDTYLEKALFYMETYKYDVVYPSVQCFGENNLIWYAVPTTFEKMIELENSVSTVAVFTRVAWENNKGYNDWPIGDQYVFEDWDYWSRLMGNGFRFKSIKEPLMLYRIHGAGLTANNKKTMEGHRLAIYNENKSLLGKNIKKSRDKNNRINYNLINPFENLKILKTKKRILLALPYLTIGGASNILHKIFKSLMNTYDITIITTIEAHAECGDMSDSFKEITHEIYHLPKFLTNNNDKQNFIYYLLETREIDLIFIVGCAFIYPLLPEIKMRYKDIIVVDQLYNEYGHIKNNRKYKKYIDMNIVENGKIEDTLINKYEEKKNKIELIRNGVDIDYYTIQNLNKQQYLEKYKVGNNKVVISFIGRFSEEKAPELFVKIAKIIIKNNPDDFLFIMAGSGPLYKKTVKEIQQNMLSEIILTPGFVDTKEILNISDLLVLPSRIDGRPNAVLEALSMGVPVVASNVGGLPEIIQNGFNGFLCTIDSVIEFKECIEKVYSDETLFKDLKCNARLFAEQNLDIQISLNKYAEVIKYALQNQRVGHFGVF